MLCAGSSGVYNGVPGRWRARRCHGIGEGPTQWPKERRDSARDGDFFLTQYTSVPGGEGDGI